MGGITSGLTVITFDGIEKFRKADGYITVLVGAVGGSTTKILGTARLYPNGMEWTHRLSSILDADLGAKVSIVLMPIEAGLKSIFGGE